MLGGHLLRGATLPNDSVIMDAVDLIEACIELMVALAIVSILTCLFHLFMLSSFAYLSEIYLLVRDFQAGPWAATVTERVKSLQSDANKAKSHKTRAVKAKEELRSARNLVKVMFDQAKAITSERDLL